MRHDLIVFGEDWGGLPSSTQHLIKQLSLTRKVIWVNSIGLRQPNWSLHDIKRVWTKLTQSTISAEESTHFAPFLTVNIKTIPAPKGIFARWIAKQLIVSQLKPLIKKAQLNHPILWTSLPTVADVCGSLGESSIVYYCGDDFGALAGVDHQVILQHEQKLIQKSDLILAASLTLCHKFPEEKVQLLPHGVDFTLFNQPVFRAKDLPNDGRPIAGFYGSLSKWLDYELINQITEINPDWHFVFIGQNELTYNPITLRDNVHLMGAKPHSQLPRYSQHWQVSLLPFIDNEQIRACNPLKLLEYLATGTPIISTDFPALHPYKSAIHTVNSLAEFNSSLNSIQQEWLRHNKETLHKRKQQHTKLIKSHTWQAKAKQLEAWLEAL
ncbi:glycosyltransferase [Aliivibrio sp. S3MY1]|uniref:glycosyltransferase n=1 Tax=unclassified Aliivibrio TaxID=2645654 RepID=UPI002379F357|nr:MULTISPECIES: glycosyltransferase [unclassified Aliivibrio]MDD9194451.1 glycosyltransferase [Aliivibrio sp. S3MY1]MDD9198210.1 glycosyltransferase [Aliivibrio sp. S2MY1]